MNAVTAGISCRGRCEFLQARQPYCMPVDREEGFSIRVLSQPPLSASILIWTEEGRKKSLVLTNPSFLREAVRAPRRAGWGPRPREAVVSR
jgi:hypothetical protein